MSGKPTRLTQIEHPSAAIGLPDTINFSPKCSDYFRNVIHGFSDCQAGNFWLIDGMTIKRSYRLPLSIDAALIRHARLQGVAPSVVLRDALANHLAVEDAKQSVVNQVRDLIEDFKSYLSASTPAADPARKKLIAMGLVKP